MVAAYEFMYVTPAIQNLVRENKSFRIDSEIQTGKKYGMQLLDDHLWALYNAGKISAEEAIDKSKNPGAMVDRMQRAGLNVAVEDEALLAEAADAQATGGGTTPGAAAAGPSGAAEAERQSQIAKNRERMAAMAAKKN
jgi:hypothetical protein